MCKLRRNLVGNALKSIYVSSAKLFTAGVRGLCNGNDMDVMVNGTLIAKGEVVQREGNFGLRLLDVVSPAERLKKLK